MNRRLVLSAAFLFSAAGIFGLLTNNHSEQETAEPSSDQSWQEEVPVWISTRSLGKGERVNASDLKPALISEQQAREKGVEAKQRFDLISGSLAAMDIKSDRVVSESQLRAPGHPEFQQLLMQPNKTRYPITFDRNAGIKPLINQGDTVDVTLIAMPGKNMASNPVHGNFQGLTAIPLLEKQKVLEVSEQEQQNRIEQTVVLALTQQDAAKVMLAKRIGILDISRSTDKPAENMHPGRLSPDLADVIELRGKDSSGHPTSSSKSGPGL